MNEEVEMIKVFWENVEFFIEKYNIPWSALLTRKDIAKAKSTYRFFEVVQRVLQGE